MSGIEVVRVTDQNKSILSQFIDNMGSSSDSFRYFKTRTIDAIKNHEKTLVLVREDDIVAYGHLDREDKLWLGICVVDTETGKGYGQMMMDYLLDDQKEPIYLTVDKANIRAVHLYEKYGFKPVRNEQTFIVMEKNDTSI